MKKTIEGELQPSEGKYYGLLKASRDAIMTVEPPTWKFTSGNPAALEMFKVKSEADFLSYEPWKLSPELQPDGRASGEKAQEMIEKALREGSNLFDWVHKRISGEEFFVEVLLSKVVVGENKFLLAVVRDISERKKMEEEKNRNLQELEVFYKASVNREERVLELKKKVEELTKELDELKKTNKNQALL